MSFSVDYILDNSLSVNTQYSYNTLDQIFGDIITNHWNEAINISVVQSKNPYFLQISRNLSGFSNINIFSKNVEASYILMLNFSDFSLNFSNTKLSINNSILDFTNNGLISNPENSLFYMYNNSSLNFQVYVYSLNVKYKILIIRM